MSATAPTTPSTPSHAAGITGWMAALLPALVTVGFVAFWIRAPSTDDAFITFRYAANMRDGLGLVFNPGESLFSVTTPLLALFLGALGSLLPEIEIAVLGYWVSVAGLLLATTCAGLICWRETQRAAAILAPVTVGLSSSLFYSLGQEMSLVLGLGLLAFYLWRTGQTPAAAATLGLLSLARPDGVLLVALILAAEVYRTRRLPLAAGAAYFAVLAPWYLYAWLTYGSPFPFSLAAKVAQAQTGWWTTTGTAVYEWFVSMLRQSPLFLAIAGLGLVWAAARVPVLLLLLAWPAMQLAAYTALGVAFYGWYLAPLHGVVALLAALGVGSVLQLTLRVWPRAVPAGTLASAGLGLALVLPSASFVPQAGTAIPDARQRQYESVGHWLDANTPPESLVGALEMGRLGYFGRRPMFDYVGLVKAPVVEHLRQKDLIWSLKEYRPAYAIAIPPDVWLFQDEWFNARYTPVQEFTDPEAYEGKPTTVYARLVGDPPAIPARHPTAVRFAE